VTLYQPRHEYQLAPTNTPVTRHSGCTWTSGATGADASTGGAKDRSPDYVHTLVKRGEETNPDKPGWSLGDLRLAMTRLGVTFDVRIGQGWGNLVAVHDAGHYVVLQGDSDQFGNNTCSGMFDGDHCIGIRPGTTQGRWLIDDPICQAARSESPATLLRYARKFDPGIRFGVFLQKVPVVKEEWQAVIHPKPGDTDGLQPFLVYRVQDHDDRPLRIVSHDDTRTGGSTYRVKAPERCVRGPGFPKSAYLPTGLCRLIDAVPHEEPGGYLDVSLCQEV
jgi:hypothetical protein